MNPEEMLREGVMLLEPVLGPAGLRFVLGSTGRGSGGAFASGAFIKEDRKLELHFRHSLGLVAYHVGAATLPHEEFVRAVRQGTERGRYPGVSSDPLQAFRDLRADLEDYGQVFLQGPAEDFLDLEAWVRANPLPQGFHRLQRGGAA
jgi:hypothetical protein